MYYKKIGLPEEGDFVICTVKKILFHSVFVILDEYENKEGMVHISEIAPGRIRNIRDYVVEGKKLVCKILRVNHKNGHIDLSLRRVNLAARKKKNEEYKQNNKAEKMLNIVAKAMDIKVDEVFQNVGDKIIDNYDSLFQGLQDISLSGDKAIKKLELSPKYASVVKEIVQERIKPPEVIVEGELILKIMKEQGIEKIKEAINSGLALINNKDCKTNVVYLGAPKYAIEVKASNYKIAENVLEKMVNQIIKKIEEFGGKGEFSKK